MQLLGEIAIALAMGFGPACGLIPTGQVVDKADLDARLSALWSTLEHGRPSGPRELPPVMPWGPLYSPLFPKEWPPTPQTLWVKYGYAYRLEKGLYHGVRISKPWATILFRHGQSSVTIVPQRGRKLEAADVQGEVFTPTFMISDPIVRRYSERSDAEARAALEKEVEVSEYCLRLVSLPDRNSPQTTDMLSFYRAWGMLNGAFEGAIRKDHEAFFKWIGDPGE